MTVSWQGTSIQPQPLHLSLGPAAARHNIATMWTNRRRDGLRLRKMQFGFDKTLDIWSQGWGLEPNEPETYGIKYFWYFSNDDIIYLIILFHFFCNCYIFLFCSIFFILFFSIKVDFSIVYCKIKNLAQKTQKRKDVGSVNQLNSLFIVYEISFFVSTQLNLLLSILIH